MAESHKRGGVNEEEGTDMETQEEKKSSNFRILYYSNKSSVSGNNFLVYNC